LYRLIGGKSSRLLLVGFPCPKSYYDALNDWQSMNWLVKFIKIVRFAYPGISISDYYIVSLFLRSLEVFMARALVENGSDLRKVGV
jgi:hypothetical protein